MGSSNHSGDPDTGISYNESSNAIQRLLDKLQKRPPQGGMMPVLGKSKSQGPDELSSKLDELIQFSEYPKPVLESAWRRIKKPSADTVSKIRDRYNNPLKKWAEEADPHVQEIANKMRKFKFGSGSVPGDGGGMSDLSSKLDDLIQFQTDPRPRNPLGEFSGNQEGAPDPNAMVKTYRIAPAQTGVAPNKSGNGPGIFGAAGLTVLGGAGGTLGAHFAKTAIDKVGKALKKARK